MVSFSINAKAQELMDFLDVAGDSEVPESAVKASRTRAGLSQTELARRSGVSHSLVVAVENGQRSLSLKSARKLAPVLGAGTDELVLAEEVSALGRMAAKGELNPRVVFDTLQEFVFADEDDDLEEELLDALVAVLKTALDNYGTSGGNSETAVSTKTARGEGSETKRDAHGRRKKKANDPRLVQRSQGPGVATKSEQAEPPRRDSYGRRTNKPFGGR